MIIVDLLDIPIVSQNTGLKMSRTMLLKDMKFTLHL